MRRDRRRRPIRRDRRRLPRTACLLLAVVLLGLVASASAAPRLTATIAGGLAIPLPEGFETLELYEGRIVLALRPGEDSGAMIAVERHPPGSLFGGEDVASRRLLEGLGLQQGTRLDEVIPDADRRGRLRLYISHSGRVELALHVRSDPQLPFDTLTLLAGGPDALEGLGGPETARQIGLAIRPAP